MITAGAALAATLVLAAYPVMSWPDVGALPLIGGAAVIVLVVSLALGLMAVVPWAIALLACEFVLALAARHVQASLTAAIYGVALLVVAELTFLSIQLRMPSRAEPGFFKRHALTVAAVALSALGIGVVAAVLSAAPLAGSLPLLASGVGAVLVMIAIVVTIVWRVEGRRQQVHRRSLEMALRVNGELRQHSSAGEMIFTVPEAIVWIFSFLTLEPGDLICMGTRGGVGETTQTYLRSGDVVEASVEGLGVSINSVE